MATPRLYFDDSTMMAFDATVVAHADWKGTPSVVLDRTAFYAEAGGQLSDRGALGAARVVDVQADDSGIVHHIIEGARPELGTLVHGAVDRDRRREHTVLHTAQHMLSRALLDEASADTVSARLGERECTIDVERAALPDADVARAEALVNAAIDDDLAIRAYFPAPSELATMALRRAPKVTENIRVVDIRGFDITPCGGTHCQHTAQVGLVRVTGLERYKGKMRVLFAAGVRARRDLGEQSDALRRLARTLTCGPSEVATSIEKLRRELSEAREALGETRARLAELTAIGLLAQAADAKQEHVVAEFASGGIEFLRQVAGRLTERAGIVALLAERNSEGLSVMIARGESSRFDCGRFLKSVATATGGRGGGRADRAEGRLPGSCDWSAVVAAELARVG